MLKIKYQYFCSFVNGLGEMQSSKLANKSTRAPAGIQNQSEVQINQSRKDTEQTKPGRQNIRRSEGGLMEHLDLHTPAGWR